MKWKKRMGYAGILILLLVGAGLFTYWKLSPATHFNNTEIPVLAAPQPEESSSPTTSSSQSSELNSSDTNDKSKDQVSFNVLILGTDARDQEASRTDVIILAHVNPGKKIVNLISIPRDSRVNLPGIGYTKINHAHVLAELKGDGHDGTMAAMQAVSNLCSCSINYYLKTNFEGFEHFIDTLGGLDIHLEEPVKFTYAHKTIPAGDNHLYGADVLDLVRERKSLPGGDSGRQAHQAMVLKEIALTMAKPQNLKKLPSLINQVKQDILDTNLTDSDMISLAWLAKDIDGDQFTYTQLPGRSDKLYDPVVKSELYYWIPDLEEWEALAKSLLGENEP